MLCLFDFSRFTLVGTHVINTIHKFLYQPVTKRDREAAEKTKQSTKKRFQQVPGTDFFGLVFYHLGQDG